MKHFGQRVKTYSPAISLSGVGNIAAHNEIHDGPHTALRFSGNDHIIEFNEFYNVMQESTDMGVIYAGRDHTYWGNKIRHNYFHDIETNLYDGQTPATPGWFTAYTSTTRFPV